MTNIFSPQEILRIAIKVEDNGEKLYEILEKKAKSKEAKDIWDYLKIQEKVHLNTFKEMLDRVGDYVVYEFSPGEYNAYIRAIASEYIFIPDAITKKIKEGFNSDSEAIDFGIYIEKESIITYTALKEYILPEKQPIINKVIEEEKDHLVKLTTLKGQMR